MKVLKINLNKPDQETIKTAALFLSRGEIVVYPTDTAYGIGVNALDEKAIQKVYKIKKRSFSKPTHVIVKNWKMVKGLTKTNELARKVYDKFFPGQLTMVLIKERAVPDILTGKLPTLGVRIPNCQVTVQLSGYLKFPYTASSANREKEKTPYSVEDVKKVLDISKVGLILDAGRLPPIPPSTIIKITGQNFKVLRTGPIEASLIREAISN